jgi:uncharacterized protein YceH (UPF0502 family)
VAQTLEMIFKNEADKNFTISLDSPNDNLTGAEVKSVMDMIISKNIFQTSGGDVVKAYRARLINKDIIDLELL